MVSLFVYHTCGLLHAKIIHAGYNTQKLYMRAATHKNYTCGLQHKNYTCGLLHTKIIHAGCNTQQLYTRAATHKNCRCGLQHTWNFYM